MVTSSPLAVPGESSAGPWPADGLERVETCPVCESPLRDRLYEGLTDRVLRCAPGEWTLFRCGSCRSAYLDPRPTPDSIGLAYRTYFTHGATPVPDPVPGFSLGSLKAGIRNGYLAARSGATFRPRFPLGRWVAYLFPFRWLRLEWSLRHLPPPDRGAKLLDIGCGNGEFVRFATSLGWDAQGLEPDPKAVAAARHSGAAVAHGGFPRTGLPDGEFDAVTLNHVIEHVHDPVGALREVHRILKPGGRIWIATPNLDGAGFHLFRDHWLSLDPPRHLMIFNASSLAMACERGGFGNAALRRPPPGSAGVFLPSLKILRNQDPTNWKGESLPRALRWRARWADLEAALVAGKGEELILTATKPKG